MTVAADSRLRVALLAHDAVSRPRTASARHAYSLARALRAAGHEPRVVCSHVGRWHNQMEDGVRSVLVTRLPETPLRRRGFTGPLTGTPGAVATLLACRIDVAHAFSAPDALAATAWRRLTGRPAVFTCAETLGRETLADRRLRLALLRRATEDTDALIAPGEAEHAALQRWLAADATVISSDDARAHVVLYGELLDR